MGLNRTLLAAVAGVLLGALVLGCLEFDGQTAYLEYDKARDRLLVIINYQALYSARSGGCFSTDVPGEATLGDIEQAKGQLADALRDKTVALLGNWPFALHLRTLPDELRQADHEMPERVRKDLLSILDHVTVQDGGFYEDAAGRPCGAQVVVVERASEAIRLLNRVINGALMAGADELRAEPGNPDEKLMVEMWLQAARGHHTWIELDGNSLVATVPIPEQTVQMLREERGREIAASKQEEWEARLRDLASLVSDPVWVWHEKDMLKVRCGLVTKPWGLVTRARQGEYRPNLAQHIRDTYGFHVDENLARYLLHADEPAETEAELAARTMAPRLTQAERVRVLVHQLKTTPSEDYWAMLRAEERPAAEEGKAAKLSDDELLKFWEGWLRKAAEGPGQEGAGDNRPAHKAP